MQLPAESKSTSGRPSAEPSDGGSGVPTSAASSRSPSDAEATSAADEHGDGHERSSAPETVLVYGDGDGDDGEAESNPATDHGHGSEPETKLDVAADEHNPPEARPAAETPSTRGADGSSTATAASRPRTASASADATDPALGMSQSGAGPSSAVSAKGSTQGLIGRLLSWLFGRKPEPEPPTDAQPAVVDDHVLVL